MTTDKKVHITLIIDGFSCSPDEISKIIGLEATKTAIAGQKYEVGFNQRKTKRVYPQNYWEFMQKTSGNTWVSTLVSVFIKENIVPRKNEIKSILSLNSEGTLSIVEYIYEGHNPGLHFEKEEIKLLGEIGLEIDIDLYCLGED